MKSSAKTRRRSMNEVKETEEKASRGKEEWRRNERREKEKGGEKRKRQRN